MVGHVEQADGQGVRPRGGRCAQQLTQRCLRRQHEVDASGLQVEGALDALLEVPLAPRGVGVAGDADLVLLVDLRARQVGEPAQGGGPAGAAGAGDEQQHLASLAAAATAFRSTCGVDAVWGGGPPSDQPAAMSTKRE